MVFLGRFIGSLEWLDSMPQDDFFSSWFLENGRSTRTNLGSHSGYVYLSIQYTEIPKIMAYLDSINMNARLNVSHHPISKHLSQALFWGVQHGHNCHNLAKGKISPHGIFPRLVSLHMFCSFLLSSGLFMVKPSLFPALTDPDKKARVVTVERWNFAVFLMWNCGISGTCRLVICFDFLVFPFRMIPKNAIQEFGSITMFFTSVWCLRFCCC